MRSGPSSDARMGSDGKACTASVWIVTGKPADRIRRVTSPIGWITPVSLFAVITDTIAVRSVTADTTSPGSTLPEESTGTMTISCPRRPRNRADSRTAACSTAVVTTPPLRARAAPTTARLSDSVPPPVNTISSGRAAPIAAAILSRASSIAFFAMRAAAWIPDGFPNRSEW